MTNSGQSIQFFCSKCDTVIKEAMSADRPSHISEECPTCGDQLSETIQVRPKQRTSTQRTLFQTAYDINASIGLGIDEIDSFLALKSGDRLCIFGEHADLVAARLCVRAFLPIKQGGLGAMSAVFIDAGNSTDIYQCVNFARRFGLDIQKVLDGIMVSRAFTIHQLASLIIHQLPEALQEFNAKLVVISDLLRMFTEDPQISRAEAEYLINEMMASVQKIDNVFLAMSLQNSTYDSQILPQFSKRISASQTDVKLYNGCRSKQLNAQFR